MRELFQCSAGQVTIRVISADVLGAVQTLVRENIPVKEMCQEDDLTASFTISAHDYKNAEQIFHKRGEKVDVIAVRGTQHKFMLFFHRKVLVAGILLVCALSVFLSTRVLVIDVDGNVSIPAYRILECAEEANIRLLASTRSVRSEDVKNRLLSALPELQWCGVNTYGSKAVISVREKERPVSLDNKSEVADIIASFDGIVRSVTVERGTAACREGDAVKQGQILISAYTDCGILIQACRAKGEIYADTLRTVQAVMPMICMKKTDIESVRKKLSLQFGKKRINLWKGSGIWDDSCDRIYKEYFIPLPGGYRLPISLSVETCYIQRTEPEAISQMEAEKILKKASQDDLLSGIIAGRILSAEEAISTEPEIIFLTVKYRCNEMIGREHLE